MGGVWRWGQEPRTHQPLRSRETRLHGERHQRGLLPRPQLGVCPPGHLGKAPAPSCKHAAAQPARPLASSSRKAVHILGHLAPPLQREKQHFVFQKAREPKVLDDLSDSICVCTSYTPLLCRNLDRFQQTLFLYSFNPF